MENSIRVRLENMGPGIPENDKHPEIYRSRLQLRPDLLLCSIKRNRVRVNIRVRLKKIGPYYPETGKHPI